MTGIGEGLSAVALISVEPAAVDAKDPLYLPMCPLAARILSARFAATAQCRVALVNTLVSDVLADG